MPLVPGSALGPYQIISLLGAGGMGEVYRARDTRLGRDVAVKILPPAFAADPERLRRFEQEARATGALNHPNILAIYDVGRHEDTPYVVSELLEGETLRDRMTPGALGARKTIEYALQIAAGLGAAHQRSIVHRDLKPENLFLTTDGHVKILDFGLAKWTGAGSDPGTAGSTAPTQGLETTPGVVLGTAGYMSPEQVRGQKADHRSDIFSLGLLLYEMLAGRRVWERGSPVETMNAILTDDPPPLSSINPSLPPALDRIVRRCLEKRAEDRFDSARDVAFALEAVTEHSAPAAAPAAAPTPAKKRLSVRIAAIAAVCAVALLTATYWLGANASTTQLPAFQRLTFRRGTVLSARFSADGGSIVYNAAWEGKSPELFSTRRDSAESRALGLAAADILAISSSGDMALLQKTPPSPLDWEFRGGTLARASLAGGAAREILENVRHADWSADGVRLAVTREVGSTRRVEFPIGKVLYESANSFGALRVSPKADRIALAERPVGLLSPWSIVIIEPDGTRRKLTEGPTGDFIDLAWTPAGDEIWFDTRSGGDKTMYAVTLSGSKRVLARLPDPLQLLDVARDGSALVVRSTWRVGILGVPPGETREREFSWLDASESDDVSNDGRTLLITEYGEGGGAGRWSVFLRKTDGSPAVRLGDGQGLKLSADGKQVLSVVPGSQPHMVILPVGAGVPVPVKNETLYDFAAAFWMPDGKRLVVVGSEKGQGPRCYLQDLASGKMQSFTPEGVWVPTWNRPVSPDGVWVAANGPGDRVMIYPVDGGEPHQVAGLRSYDTPLRWSADGRSLYVLQAVNLPGQVLRVDVATGKQQPILQVAPSDTAGVTGIYGLQLGVDEKWYFYTYKRDLSDLYLVRGLR